MKILNFGSLNRDLVYTVDHAVRPGETISSGSMEPFCGGKGLNQSLALARAGAEVYHAGCIGSDGSDLLRLLQDSGVDTRYIRRVDGPSGHAIIQVDGRGQNSILLFGGANRRIPPEAVEDALGISARAIGWCCKMKSTASPGLWSAPMTAVCGSSLNPSPFDGDIARLSAGKGVLVRPQRDRRRGVDRGRRADGDSPRGGQAVPRCQNTVDAGKARRHGRGRRRRVYPPHLPNTGEGHHRRRGYLFGLLLCAAGGAGASGGPALGLRRLRSGRFG